MFETFTPETRRAFVSAVGESRLRGARRVGTEHLLLGLLHADAEPASRALGVDLAAGRDTLDRLDQAALAAVDVTGLHHPGPLPAAPKRPTLTSGARTVLTQAAHDASDAKGRRITTGHLLLALLAADQPDSAAVLLAELGVNRNEVRERLAASGA